MQKAEAEKQVVEEQVTQTTRATVSENAVCLYCIS